MALKRNVLIFHAGALGDFVLSWPLAMAAGRLFAQSRVFYVTSKQKGELAERALRLESVDGEVGWHSLFGNDPQLPPTPARLLAGAHTVVSFVAETGSNWGRNVTAATSGADLLVLAPHPPTDFSGHHTDFLLSQLTSNIVWQQGVAQMLASIRQRGIGLAGAASDGIVLHPGSGSPGKCWPLEHFVSLARQLRQLGKSVKIVVGEVERERMSKAQLAVLADAADLHQPTSLVKLLALLRQAGVFVGNDSGPSHLAGMLGLKTVTLFGKTDPGRWKPIGPNVQVVQGQQLASITPEQVIEVLS